MTFLRVLQRCSTIRQCTRRTYASSSAATSSASASSTTKKAPAAAAAAAPISSCAPDTVLTGANYLKGQPPVLAKPDEGYPEWLWTILQPKVWPDDGPGGKAERVKRRQENKQRIKDRNFMQTQ